MQEVHTSNHYIIALTHISLSILSILSVLSALAVLYKLWVIDLKIRLLPNKYVLLFAVLGVVFHAALLFALLPPLEMLKGAALGGGILYAIRFVANWHYKQDALGLGDVKLMAAAGLWLGAEGILIALTLGALAGVFHGLGAAICEWRKTKAFPNMGRLQIPAGPGFIVGIIFAALAKFSALPHLLF